MSRAADHRGGVIEGRNFTSWFINEYMISNETLYHTNLLTREPQVIGLGWLDDSMGLNGPSEEDKNYIADTCVGGSPTSTECIADQKAQVDACECTSLR